VAEWLDDAPNWISSTEAEELLGIRRDAMLKLSYAGLMQTKRGGVPGLMDTRNFHKQDVEQILSAFRRGDAPVVDLCGKANWVVLGKRGYGKALGANALGQVVAAVCGGRLLPVGKLRPNARLCDYVFDREKINEHIKADFRYSRAELMNRSEVEAFLAISQDVLDALIAEKLLTLLPSSEKRGERLFIKREVSKFADTHVFAAHVARSLNTQSTYIRKQLSRLGVEGKVISYPLRILTNNRFLTIDKFEILGLV
jgi:putative intracellular protease/amidase